jgi:two-component system NtrC family response regulator
MKTLLIVDDEPNVRFSLDAVFGKQFRVILAADGAAGARAAEEESPDVAIVDMMLPDMSGLDLLPRLKAVDAQLPIIVLSAVQEIGKVVQAIQGGACHYLTKPFDVSEIKIAVERVLRERGKSAELTALSSEMDRWYDTHQVVGQSRPWEETLTLVRRAAEAPDTTVMFYGESGTGKELLARLLHAVSPRCDGPFIPIHCAAIPEALLESELFGHEKGSFTGASERRHGRVELADGGTLFLDEIGEMPPAMQSKLLRFLQDHEYMRVGGRTVLHANVRIVGATNRDLQKGVREGWFREDLYFRINVLPITIPPLRERRDDIAPLAAHYVAHFRRECRSGIRDLLPATVAQLEAYAWPGNVRELRNVIERALVLYRDASLLMPEHLPAEIRGAKPAPTALAAPSLAAAPPPVAPAEDGAPAFPISLEAELRKVEERLIRQAVEASNGNLSQAAVLLQTTRRILKYKADQMGLV